MTSCKALDTDKIYRWSYMNLLDFIFCFFLIFFIIKGVIKGFIKELAVIAGGISGFYFAYLYYSHLASVIIKFFPHFKYSAAAGFLIIFFVTFIVVHLLGAFINYVLKLVLLKWVDRILGAFLGALKGVFVIAVLLIALTAFLPKGNTLVHNSVMAPYVFIISNNVVNFIPKDVKNLFDSKIKSLIAYY